MQYSSQSVNTQRSNIYLQKNNGHVSASINSYNAEQDVHRIWATVAVSHKYQKSDLNLKL